MNQTKKVGKKGDYYYCSECDTWHRLTADSDSLSRRHISYFDEERTNASNANYYYCIKCSKWHRGSYDPHLNFKAYIKSAGKVISSESNSRIDNGPLNRVSGDMKEESINTNKSNSGNHEVNDSFIQRSNVINVGDVNVDGNNFSKWIALFIGFVILYILIT
ncbi:hypothetical protein [Methanohalophilus sp.]